MAPSPEEIMAQIEEEVNELCSGRMNNTSLKDNLEAHIRARAIEGGYVVVDIKWSTIPGEFPTRDDSLHADVRLLNVVGTIHTIIGEEEDGGR
jgi:hypothetical protein